MCLAYRDVEVRVSTMPSVSRNQPWPGGRGVSKGTAGGRHKAGGGLWTTLIGPS